MLEYKRDFIRFAIETGVLSFGDYTLKSGRSSPYFFNTGGFSMGGDLALLGRYYAHAILASGIRFDVLYGPAYKGIPLVATTSIALAEDHGRSLVFAFNRKEGKSHGEGGQLIGGPLSGDVLILDDVLSAGTSAGESVAIIRAAGARPAGLVIALDRQERGRDERSAVESVRDELGIPVHAIVCLDDLIAYMREMGTDPGQLETLEKHRAHFGCASARREGS